MGLEITSDDEKLKCEALPPPIRISRAGVLIPCVNHDWSHDERVSIAFAGAMTRYCKKCPAEALSEMMKAGSLE